jgi:hypothetical protein
MKLNGSVLSVGVAYDRDVEAEEMARRLAPLFGEVLIPPVADRWPVRLVGAGAREVWVEAELKAPGAGAEGRTLLTRLMGATYGELLTRVDLAGIGSVPGILRPALPYGGVLLDLAEANVCPQANPASSSRATAAAKELLLRWYHHSRFVVAFADHEAEFEVDPDRLRPADSPYALMALPAAQGDGARLDFYSSGWPLSPLGA